MKEEWFADDRCIIPEYIKKMTIEEMDAEIARLEEEARKEKERIEQTSAQEPPK